MDNKEYSIVASAEAFETLSSKLYTNPVAAVIRELSSNAYDSHIAKGNIDKPFDLHIPTDKSKFFSIRDYGEGMSNDFIMSVFTTYFASTKGNKDDQIGGFGLGSKTPYALVDEYYVTSYFEGKKTKFKMSKRNGCPIVEKQSEEETDEPSGLEIKFDLSSNWGSSSESKWYRETVKFFSGFMCQPNWNLNLDENNLKKLALSKYYYNKCGVYPQWEENNIIANDYYVTVNVAGVIYGVKSSIIDAPYPFSRVNIMADKNDVTVTPSREELHYDDKTIKFIVDNVNKVIKENVKDIFDKIDDLSYDFNNLRKMTEYNSDNLVSYNGQKIEEKAKELLQDVFEEKCYRLIKNSVKRSHIHVSYSRYYYGSKENTFVGILSSEGCKTTQLNTIKSTLAETGDKVSSKAFCDRVKNFFNANGKNQSDCDLVIVSVKEGKEDIAKKILNGKNVSYEIFKYSDYANSGTSKKESSTRRGFITQGSLIYNNYVSTSGYNRAKTDPNVRDNEIPLVTSCDYVNSFERYFPLLQIVKPVANIVLRICKESSSIENVCKQNKCEDAIEWAKRIIIENKAKLDKYIKTAYSLNICSKVLRSRSFVYDTESYKESRSSLFALNMSNNAKRLLNSIDYVQTNYKLVSYSNLIKDVFREDCTIKDCDDIFTYDKYPMLKYLDRGSVKDIKEFCTDCLEYITYIDNH